MSPERIIGDSYGYASDIWSFGVTIYTVAEGLFPFSTADTTYWGMISAVCDDPVPIPPDPKYSDDFRSFIADALVKDPDNRANATDLLNHMFITENVEMDTLDGPPSPMSKPQMSTLSKLTSFVTSKKTTATFEDEFDDHDHDRDLEVDPVKMEHLECILESLYDMIRTAIIAEKAMKDDRGGSGDLFDGSITPLQVPGGQVGSPNVSTKSILMPNLELMQEAARGMRSSVAPSVTQSRNNSFRISAVSRPDDFGIEGNSINSVVVRASISSKQRSPSSNKHAWEDKSISRALSKSKDRFEKSDIHRMLKIAGFSTPGDLRQWKHLARQLHLPYSAVLDLAKQRLLGILNEFYGEPIDAAYVKSMC